MICILHGYLLDGSGSNLWTQSILRALVGAGETVHVTCQEPHPEKFDFVARAVRYDERLRAKTVVDRDVPYPGQCIMHKPRLGGVLPVYVWDQYEEFEKVVPMVDLDDATVEDYLARHVAVLEKIVSENPVTAVLVNHAVLMSVVAERVCGPRGIPFAIMPHGSAIEYAVTKDTRFYRYAAGAFAAAKWIFVIGPELRQRVQHVFAELPGVAEKIVDLNLGVDTALFEPIEPARRRQNIEQLERTLAGVERGKRPELSIAMRHRLGDTMDRERLRTVFSQASGYTARHTDFDCEAKLRVVDWEHEKTLLFVGRLIVSKGIQCVVAALPSILEQVPNARLLVVGHGPMREPIEAMLWALEHGKRELLENIIGWGRSLEGAREPEPLDHVRAYVDALEREGTLDRYFEVAREARVSQRAIFTGYLTHRELRFLFPCCDVAIFPSIVAEAGPLVFLEAMASGAFPLGVSFAGMAASIDSTRSAVPAEVADLMKLRQAPEHTVADIVSGSLGAFKLGRAHAGDLRRVAAERYDWRAVGTKLLDTLESA